MNTRFKRNLYKFLMKKTPYGAIHWKMGVNRPAVRAQRKNPLRIESTLSHLILRGLIDDGIYVFPVNELSGGSDMLKGMLDEEKALIDNNQARIERQRLELANPIHRRHDKVFLVDMYSGNGHPDFALSTIQFGLHPELLSVVNEYLGMYAKLRYSAFWLNLSNPDQDAYSSQFWHRDHEDRKQVKVFIYLEDVDKDSGPFCFIPGMHKGKLRKKDPPDSTGKEYGTIRADDRAMNKIVAREKWFTGIAPKGTVIVADTKSYHKGGLAINKDRHLFTSAYYSTAYPEIYMKDGITGVPQSIHPAIQFAAKQ